MPNGLASNEEISGTKTAHAICVVDDDSSVLRSLTRMLESDCLPARAFAEPRLFLQHVATHAVSVVVMDVWMERMTGMELLAHLCARSPRTRVIFITGHADRAAEVTVMAAGAFAFLVKPFDGRQFLSEVHRALAIGD